MNIFKNLNSVISYRKKLNGSVGLVPTMGALHDGHKSLIKKSIKQNKYTIVSIFVNPTQFSEGEDYGRYPRNLEKDISLCIDAGVDIIFTPKSEQIYLNNELSIKIPYKKALILEGEHRSSFFNGIIWFLIKLFNITKPNRVYFGKKDSQMVSLIQDMVRTLMFDIEVVACPILRDKDGIALSSRLIYLNSKEKDKAKLIYNALLDGKSMILNSIRDSKRIKDKIISSLGDLDVSYVEILNRKFEVREEVVIGNIIIVVAVNIGGTRLLDALWL